MNMPAYQVGGCLPPDASSYVVRSADEELYQYLRSGEFCYVLNSRQMGKSSLRVQTMQRLQQEGVVCASVDITELGAQQVTPEKWYGGLTKTLVTRLKLEEKFSLRNWLSEHKDIPPVQFFREFIEEVLLTQILEPIVIFIDEIDSVLQLSFKDDFFALIRACYNKRADNPAYNRLCFVLLGVATPGDLIEDKDRTPFNIGRAVELHGFELHEVEPLAKGLSKYAKAEGRGQKAEGKEEGCKLEGNNNCLGGHDIKPKSYNPNADAPYIATATLMPSDSWETLKEILYWTGGQPFLTQKLCQLLVSESEREYPRSVEQVVREQIISNWEASDEPEHLKTIRDRILGNEQRAAYLLELYQQVWQQGEVVANNSFEEGKLQLSGLVVKQRVGSSPVLKVYNRIYHEVFNQDWIEQELAALRPYSEAFRAWVASGGEDESLLLRGKTLRNAQDWAKGKNLSYLDQQFLAASEKKVIEEQLAASQLEAELERQRKDREAAQKRNQVLAKANVVLTEANRKAQQRIKTGAVVLIVAVLGAVVSGVLAGNNVIKANSEVKEANNELAQTQEYLALAQGEIGNIEKKADDLEQQQIQISEELEQARKELFTLAQQREQAYQESQRLAQQAQQAAQETQQAKEKLSEAQESLKTADLRVQQLNRAEQEKAKELEQAQRELHIAQKEQKSAQENLARVETEIETVSLLSKLAAELHNNGLSTEAQEAWSQASKATDEILEKEENRELKQAMLQASISLASLKLSQKYNELDKPEEAEEYREQAEQAIKQSEALLLSNVAVDSLEKWSIYVHIQRVSGSWYRENGETQKAISAYRQAFSLLDTAWKKLPNIDDINTEIPIPQYLPQKQPILSANAIENLHREFMALLAETGEDNSLIFESLKGHYLAELNFFMESDNWRDADTSTNYLILFAGSIKGKFEWDNISCPDFRTIDRLWVECSEGTFGFSVQKPILDELAPAPGRYNELNWDRFYEKIGWKEEVGKELKEYDQGVFNPKKAVVGHLPNYYIEVDLWIEEELGRVGWGVARVLLQLVHCSI